MLLRPAALALSLVLFGCGDGPPEASTEPRTSETVETRTPAINGFSETELTAPGPEGDLSGTLVTPDAPLTDAVVLLIPGSGPTNRDGGQGKSGPRPLRDLAYALAKAGVPSLRADKRGMFGSREAVANPNAVTLGDYAADAASWIDTLDSPCVVIAGHSEGGLVAMKAAATGDACGLVLLATPGRSLDIVLEEQLRSNPANVIILDEALDIIARIRSGERVETMNPLLEPLFRLEVQDYLENLFTTNPAVLATNVDVPMLIIGGERDIQVTEDDFKALTAAQPGAESVLYPEMSHVLTDVGEGRVAAMQAYLREDAPLTDGLAERIATFVIASAVPPDE